MDTEPIARVSENQRQCLRLIARGYGTDEVASALGITSVAVTERLREARRILGVTSSKAAARLLAAHEEAITRSLVDKISVIAAPPESAMFGASSRQEMMEPWQAGTNEVREEQAAFEQPQLSMRPPSRPAISGDRLSGRKHYGGDGIWQILGTTLDVSVKLAAALALVCLAAILLSHALR